jgi:GT2 family glycosyltransferase
VDNNSDPPLQDANYLEGFPLEIVRQPVQGLTAAREMAVREADGRIILFVDDDNVLAPGYLRRVVASFSDPRLGVLGARILPEYESAPPGWLASFEEHLAIRRYPADCVMETTGLPYTGYFPVGAGCAVLRTVALAYLDDAATRGRIEGRNGSALSSGEDLDLDLFALGAGYKLRVDGALTVTHVIPSTRLTEGYISRLLVANVRSCDELERKWRPTFGTPIFPYLRCGVLAASLRESLFRLCSPLSVRSRLKADVWREIRRVQAKGAPGSVQERD